MVLDLIAIATTVAFLHDVPALDEVIDNRVGAPLRHAKFGRKLSQTHVWFPSDTQ